MDKLIDIVRWIVCIPAGAIIGKFLTYLAHNLIRFQAGAGFMTTYILPLVTGGLQLFLFVAIASYIAPRNDKFARNFVAGAGIVLLIIHLYIYHSTFNFLGFMLFLISAVIGLLIGLASLYEGDFDSE